MRCEEIIFEFIPFYCGELDEKKEKEYKRHTVICKECARRSFRIRKAMKYLKENMPQSEKIDLSEEIKIRR